MEDDRTATTLHPLFSYLKMLFADQSEFSSKKKVVLHVCIPMEIYEEPCYTELQPDLYLKML